jgi:hypothetical protein
MQHFFRIAKLHKISKTEIVFESVSLFWTGRLFAFAFIRELTILQWTVPEGASRPNVADAECGCKMIKQEPKHVEAEAPLG